MNLINLCDFYGIDNIFKDIVLPDNIDKEILINTILDKCSLNEPLYYDMNLLNQKIKNFFLKNYDVYNRLVKAFSLEYNPIENYDRKEDTSRNIKRETNNSNIYNENSVSDISAFDSNGYQKDSKNVIDSDRKENNNLLENESFSNRVHGNIGVTTTQQMLESELNLRKKLNIYEIIANDFYDNFMLFIM